MNRKKIIILVFIALIGIFLSVVGYLLNKNSADVFDVLNNAYTELNNFFGEEINLNNKIINLNINYEANTIKRSNYSPFANILIGNKYNINLQYDYVNNRKLLNLTSSFDKSEDITITRYYENNIEYSNVPLYHEKYIVKEHETNYYNTVIDSLKIDLYKVQIIKKIIDNICNKQNQIYFTNQYYTLSDKVNSSENELNNITISSNMISKILINTSRNLKNNKKFIDKYTYTYDKSFNLNDYVDSVKKLISKELLINVYKNIYTGKISEIEIITMGYDDSAYETYLKIDVFNDKYEFSFSNGKNDISGSLYKKNNVFNLDLIIPLLYEDNTMDELEIHLDFSYKYIDDIDKPNITSYDSYSEMLYEDINDLYQLITERDEIYNLQQIYNRFRYITQG